MFTNGRPLSFRDYANLTLQPTTDYGFAAGRMFIPVVLPEIADVAREYPLVFISDQPLPVALTGIERDRNAYVGEDGSWHAQYIPASIRAYPFALARTDKRDGEYAIVIDADAPQLADRVGSPLFDSRGQPMPILRARMELLKKTTAAEPATRKMVETLRASGLLVDRAIQIKRPDHDDAQIAGIQVIDERKLNGLPGDAFLKLRDSGLLPLIYAHLLSMANLRQGAIAGRYPDLANRPQAPQKDLAWTASLTSDLDLESLVSDDDDIRLP